MIIVFYDKDSNVHVNEYEYKSGVFNLIKNKIYFNDYRECEFYKVTGVTNEFLAYVVLKIQDSFKNKRVFIFENNNQISFYDMSEMINTLFVYRKELTVIQASISEDDIEDITRWLANHM